MYKDIISYELATDTDLEKLLEVAAKVADDWMKNQKGFIKWEIHTNQDGSYTDIVYWESREAAKNAEKEMANNSHAQEWFACYKEGCISSKNLTFIAKF